MQPDAPVAPPPAPAGRKAITRTDRWKPVFLETLATTCNATAAARAAGVSRDTVYRRRAADPSFEGQWEDALQTWRGRTG